MSTQQHCGNDGKYLHTTPLMGCLDHLATGCVKYLSNTWPFHEHCAGGRTTETEMAVHHSLYHGEQERPSPIYVSVAYAYGRPQSPAAWEQGSRKVASTPDESELSVYDSQVPAEGLFSSQVLQMRFHAASQQECLQGMAGNSQSKSVQLSMLTSFCHFPAWLRPSSCSRWGMGV